MTVEVSSWNTRPSRSWTTCWLAQSVTTCGTQPIGILRFYLAESSTWIGINLSGDGSNIMRLYILVGWTSIYPLFCWGIWGIAIGPDWFWLVLTRYPGGCHPTRQVNESGGGDPSLEVRLEPLWRRSTLVDLAKVARLIAPSGPSAEPSAGPSAGPSGPSDPNFSKSPEI